MRRLLIMARFILMARRGHAWHPTPTGLRAVTSLQKPHFARVSRLSVTVDPPQEATDDPSGTIAASELRRARIEKVEAMRSEGVEPFEYTFDATHTAAGLQKEFASLADGEEVEDVSVSVAGRVMARRVFGKLAFFTLQDESGSVQLYLDKKKLGEEFKKLLAWSDAGDILGARGSVKRTQKGELSVNAEQWTMLTKALAPLPDKWHGLTDVSKRYRQRHVDMIVNPKVRETFLRRAQITASIRQTLNSRGFLEV